MMLQGKVVLYYTLFLYSFVSTNDSVGQVLSATNENNANTWISNVFAARLWGFTPDVDLQHPECERHGQLYRHELAKLTLWAVQMSDSNADGVTGLLGGDTHNLGHFDSCVSVAVPNISLAGQYCLATLHFHLDKNTDRHYPIQYDPWTSAWEKLKVTDDPFVKPRNLYRWGVCVPASCSAVAVEMGLQAHLEPALLASAINATVSLERGACYARNRETYSAGFYIILSIIFALFGAVMVASIYDLVAYKWNEDKTKPSGQWRKTILAFSLYTNVHRLVKPDSSEEFNVLHGMRAYTIMIVVAGHRNLFTIAGPLISSEFVEVILQDIRLLTSIGGPLFVDTFFFMSAFLASHFMLRELERTDTLPVIKIYILRLARILPTYMLIVAFRAVVFVHLGEGPLWQMNAGVEAERCQHNWWLNMLFINNYVAVDNLCILQSWFLACDMHYSLLAPLVVFALWKCPNKGMVLLSGLTVAAILVPSVLVYLNNYDVTMRITVRMIEDMNEESRLVYTKTHMRAIPFMMGIAAAYLYRYLMAKKIALSKAAVELMTVAGFVVYVINLLVGWQYHLARDKTSTVGKAVYASLHRIVWAMLLALLVIIGGRSQHGMIRPFLTIKGLVPLSRLSLCAFLVHDSVQIYSVSMLRSSDYFDITKVAMATFADIVTTYLLALMCFLLCEGPAANLIKLVLLSTVMSKKDSNDVPELEPKVQA